MSECDVYILKYQQLLRDLKTTVEGLLVTQVSNVWNIYGGLNRLHCCMEKIFKHGCKCQEYGKSSCLPFIQGLEWLTPESSRSYVSIDCEYKPYMPQHLKNNKAAIWLYCSLQSHTLSQKLSWLLTDRNHLLNCYQKYAFLCQKKYAEATLICLQAVERNQASLMSEINPSLFLSQSSAKEFHKHHRRCSSFPDNFIKHNVDIPRKSSSIYEFKEVSDIEQPRRYIKGKLRPWNSMPVLQVDFFKMKLKNTMTKSKTTPSTPVYNKKISSSHINFDSKSLQHPKMKKSNLKKSRIKKETKHIIIQNCNIIEHTPMLSCSQSSSGTVNDDLMNLSVRSMPENNKIFGHSPRLVESFLPLSGEKDYKKTPKKSFIEDGGMSVLPMATGYFPKPAKGQSLLSFLTSGQFARASAELDRENAHFRLSEAIISAMEQIKCNRELKLSDDQLDESDPEILDLKQRIRLRRREKFLDRHKKLYCDSLLSDGITDTTTTASPCSTTPDTYSECGSSDDIDDVEVDDALNLPENHGFSISMASLYSKADVSRLPRGVPDGASDIFSAEGVALSLISRFNEKQLPKASDLEWLVSEDDAPQALLPLPKSWPVSPDEMENSTTSLRGTQEWAPPRPQIIFTIHPPISRKALMMKQNYRCAGCGMNVLPQYASRFRYCDYLGRYFCTGCHTDQLAIVPGRVLQKWDFRRYPVSTFSYRLLEQMYHDPLFRIFELNKNIAKFSRKIQICRNYRLGLLHLKDFIFTCKYAENVQAALQNEKSYIFTDPEVYSMDDLVNIRTGTMNTRLKNLVQLCCEHTSNCNLCFNRGFICEKCGSEDVIFPWQMKIVSRCNNCGMCYHSRCWNPRDSACSRCMRINKRKEMGSSDTT